MRRGIACWKRVGKLFIVFAKRGLVRRWDVVGALRRVVRPFGVFAFVHNCFVPGRPATHGFSLGERVRVDLEGCRLIRDDVEVSPKVDRSRRDRKVIDAVTDRLAGMHGDHLLPRARCARVHFGSPGTRTEFAQVGAGAKRALSLSAKNDARDRVVLVGSLKVLKKRLAHRRRQRIHLFRTIQREDGGPILDRKGHGLLHRHVLLLAVSALANIATLISPRAALPDAVRGISSSTIIRRGCL